MSKNISISDEVYRKLKREKGDRSFSEVIAAHLEAENRISDVTGAGILDDEATAAARHDIERLSERTIERLGNETG